MWKMIARNHSKVRAQLEKVNRLQSLLYIIFSQINTNPKQYGLSLRETNALTRPPWEQGEALSTITL